MRMRQYALSLLGCFNTQTSHVYAWRLYLLGNAGMSVRIACELVTVVRVQSLVLL